jgi:branched-chain amino acid aminotransferase
VDDNDVLDFDIVRNPYPLPAAERRALVASPAFGRVFTDHMVTISYEHGKGWYDARVRARAPIALDPATAALHYGQGIFEGLKAYSAPDGGVCLFRPDANARRFAASARRMAMPELPERVFLDAVRHLVHADRDWVPTGDETSLYLRPFMFATEVSLMVRPSNEFMFVVLASPTGSYFTGGVSPISVWVPGDYSRTAPGGTGEAKCAGNYAGSLIAQAQAAEHGCDQALFLDAVEHRRIEELGGMNVFLGYADGTLVTPGLTGTVLPGITRDAVLTLARAGGHVVVERPVTFDECRAAAADGSLREVFACGTAAVVTPVGQFRWPGGRFTVSDGGTGPLTAVLRRSLVDIQRGRAVDPYGWVHHVEAPGRDRP